MEFPQTDCPVCLLILREPQQLACCGNSYCEACVKRVQDDKKCCPTCNEADFTVFPDKRLKRSLYALNVYCCQRSTGCEWAGELGELDRHLNLQPPPEKLLVGCQFAEVDCTYCVQPFQRRYVQAHQLDDCPKQPFTCQHCNQHVATFEKVAQDHWPVCLFFPLSCPNNCEVVVQRQELERHVSCDCPLMPIRCDFHMIGCQVKLPRRNMPSHISESLAKHLSLMVAHMTAELQETRHELQESQKMIAQLEYKLIASEQKIKTQEITLSYHQKMLEEVMYTGDLSLSSTREQTMSGTPLHFTPIPMGTECASGWMQMVLGKPNSRMKRLSQKKTRKRRYSAKSRVMS